MSDSSSAPGPVRIQLSNMDRGGAFIPSSPSGPSSPQPEAEGAPPVSRSKSADPLQPNWAVLQNAEFVVSPKNLKEWVIQQLTQLNLANIALLITILAVSANINSQLDQQRAYGVQSQNQIDDLRAIIEPAQAVAASLQANKDLVVAFNATLDRAIKLGFVNLTGQISDVRQQVTNEQANITGQLSDVRTNSAAGSLGLAAVNATLNAFSSSFGSRNVVLLDVGAAFGTTPPVGAPIPWSSTVFRGTGVQCTSTVCTMNEVGLYSLYFTLAASGAGARIDYAWTCVNVPSGGSCAIARASGASFTGSQNVAPHDAVATMIVSAANLGVGVTITPTLVAGSVDQYYGYIRQL